MIRLTTWSTGDKEYAMRVEGRLTSDSLGELQQAILMSPRVTSIDLAGVLSMDESSARFLSRMEASGCQLSGASLYVKRQIEGAGS
jgi:hypothetical protein